MGGFNMETIALFYVNKHGRKMYLMKSGSWVNEKAVNKRSIKIYRRWDAAVNKMMEFNRKPGMELVSVCYADTIR
jgi:hypothetical protein